MEFASLVSRTQIVLGIAVIGSSLALAAACSSNTTSGTGDGGTGTSGGTSGATSGGTSGATSGGTSGGTSGSSINKCGSTSGSSCTDAEIKPYSDCVLTACDSQYTMCYGAGWKTGSYTGPCGTYLTCINACACGDTACLTACKPSTECTTCSQGLGTCSQSCTVPACAMSTSGGTSGTSGTSGSSGTTGKTCADFAACCAAKSGSAQTSCQQAYDAIKASGDATCNAAYSSYCP